MTHKSLRRSIAALASMLVALLPLATGAEDIDIFVGNNGGGGISNVLIVIDNTSNWSRQDQQWPGGITQGQSELLALQAALNSSAVDSTVNVGLMLFTDANETRQGGYIRYAMRPMNQTNKTNLQNLLQTIYNNFSTPQEKVGSNANYSGVLFDAYKYYGGYTSPAHAHDDVAGTPLGATVFGTLAHASVKGGGTDQFIPLADPAGYTNWSNPPPTGDTLNYLPPAAAVDACGGKNYIIFVGNGFPNSDTNPQDDLSAFLAGVGGDTTQIPLNTFTTTTTTTATPLGQSSACYTNNKSGLSSCNTDAAATCSAQYSSCSCATSGASTTGCTGSKVTFPVSGNVTTTNVTPTGTTAPPTNLTLRYADEWTRFMYLTDVNSAAGQQNVATYAIDVFNAKQDANQTALLYNMANSAGGKYFAAKNQNDIQTAFAQAFAEIKAVNSTFASASLPVSATNRAQNLNQVFIGMFRPDASADPLWYGNMKRYQIANFSGDYKLADANKIDAINNLTGFFTDCATSYWTSDSGKYWYGIPENPSPAGGCTAPVTSFDPFSDSPDGPKVEKGAVAEVLRLGNNPPTTTTTPTWTLNRNVYTKNFVTFNAANSGMAQADVDFISGLNVNSLGATQSYSFVDPSGATQTTTIRPTIHGDVVHSRPLPVNYGGTIGTVVYYGANDGNFRAVNAATGKELWSYVAPEFFGTLPRLRQDSPQISYPTIPLTWYTSTPKPKDYYFDGSIGLYQNADNSKVWIFPSMRRGGRMLYAFDVTTPTSPTLKWKVGCPDLTDDTNCTSGMSGIGQTWSTPNVATLKVGGTVGETPTTVVAVGGGYDNCEDGAAANACSGAKGSIVYILNADTGAVIASFPTAGRVVADVALVDLDVDGIPDLAYVVDTRGDIYRISFGLSKTAPLASSAYTMTKVAYTAGANRKFLYAPALLPTYDTATGGYFVYLALGSGDREQPLYTQYPYTTPVLNRFYVYLDSMASTTAANLDDAATLANLTSDPGCGAPALVPGSTTSGWYMDLDVCGPNAADCAAGSTTKGEQVVTSAVIVGGLVAFSTNRAIYQPNVCAPLGEARGYLVNLFNSSGTIGSADATCGASRSSPFVGGGLPPSPVVGTVMVDGRPVTILIGAANKKGGTSTSLQGQEGFTLKPQRRYRIFYRQEGNH